MYCHVQVSGSVDSVFSMGASGEHRSSVLQQAEASARARAIQAGADADSCQVVHFHLIKNVLRVT